MDKELQLYFQRSAKLTSVISSPDLLYRNYYRHPFFVKDEIAKCLQNYTNKTNKAILFTFKENRGIFNEIMQTHDI